METYLLASEKASKIVTEEFSTSFSSSSAMLDKAIRNDIYNIYALVRIADEIVDTYKGDNAKILLSELESDVYRAIKTGFSANIIVHAFAVTARTYAIPKSLITPFFASMCMDLTPQTYTNKKYKDYIYGSAEVVGLLCLLVFVGGDQKQYKKLQKGAMALGSAFQKVNFLRDIKDDYETRQRYYFPIGSYEEFDEKIKKNIENDIAKDLALAAKYVKRLPINARTATRLAYVYYVALHKKIIHSSAAQLKSRRIRINAAHKLRLLIMVRLGLL